MKNESLKGLNGLFQKMRIKNLRGGAVRFDLKKLDSFTLETSKNNLIRNFLRAGRVRVKQYCSIKEMIRFFTNLGLI